MSISSRISMRRTLRCWRDSADNKRIWHKCRLRYNILNQIATTAGIDSRGTTELLQGLDWRFGV